MILSGSGVNSYTIKAATTTTPTTGADNATMMTENQPQQPQSQQSDTTTDFWWWPTQNSENNTTLTGHQHQQISSSSSQQQQQQTNGGKSDGSGPDEFDAFDLSLLINGSGDGYFSDNTADCRVPAAAFSATVMVHTNAALNAGADSDYYASTTTTQQQLDLQQLMSLCDDYCFFNGDAAENEVKPTPIFHEQQQLLSSPATAVVTTTTSNASQPSEITAADLAAIVPSVINTAAVAATTTTTTADLATNNSDNAAKTTLLRSLLTSATTLPTSPPTTTVPPTRLVDSAAAPVESTTVSVAAITTTNGDAQGVVDKSNKHRLLIEMLRGGSNDDVVVPAMSRLPRRRPRTAAFGTDDEDDGESAYGVRRRLDVPQHLIGDGHSLPQEDVTVDDELLLYGGPYYSATASPSWLDRMVAAAAAATAGANTACGTDQRQDANRRQQPIDSTRDDIDSIVDECCSGSFCNDYDISSAFDQNAVDGGYFSVASADIAYSPPTAAQVPSVTPPPPACGDRSKTTSTSEGTGIVQQMCWKSTTETTASDDYYDRLLMTVMMEAEAAAPLNNNRSADCGSTDGVGNISSSSSNSSSSSASNSPRINDSCVGTFGDGHIILPADGGLEDAVDADQNDSKSLVQLQLQRLAATTKPKNALTTAATTTATTAANVATTSPPPPPPPSSSSQHIHLWQFLKELLTASATAERTASPDEGAANRSSSPSPATSTSPTAEYTPLPSSSVSTPSIGNKQQQQQMIRWLDRKQGVFKIEDSQAVARLWGLRKKRPAMNYDKLSRSLRQYYKKKIMQKTERSQRLVYQFCPPYNA